LASRTVVWTPLKNTKAIPVSVHKSSEAVCAWSAVVVVSARVVNKEPARTFLRELFTGIPLRCGPDAAIQRFVECKIASQPRLGIGRHGLQLTGYLGCRLDLIGFFEDQVDTMVSTGNLAVDFFHCQLIVEINGKHPLHGAGCLARGIALGFRLVMLVDISGYIIPDAVLVGI